jgi:exopolysaccharide biosynthesis protein
MGDLINVMIDDIHALLSRIGMLPLVLQLLVWMLVFGGFVVFFIKYLERWAVRAGYRKNPYMLAISLLMVSMMVFTLISVDQRYDQMELMLLNDPGKTYFLSDSTGNKSYFSRVKSRILANKNLNITEARLIQDSAGLEVVKIHSATLKFSAYVATIDLNRVDIKLHTPIDIKTKTSDFAKINNLDFAINGEAGRSPGLDAPLGQWEGMYISNGNAIKIIDDNRRPFIYFNRNSKAGYSCDSCIVLKPTPDMYNAIWGRWDLIMNGQMAIDPRDNTKNKRYPRTIMAIDRNGMRGFFMVADGRRPGYSLGMTMEQCAQLMLDFGAYNGMACDQGGSSLIYSKKLGIINRPADGAERPVYTHFGFKIKK